MHNQLELLAEEPSTLNKENMLNEFLRDALFLKVVQYALDPRRKYKTKKLPPFLPGKIKDNDRLFAKLDALAEQDGASKFDKRDLGILASIDEETWEVVHRICNGDLRCGAGQRMINKVRPHTVPFTPYLRCSSKKQIHKATFPAIWQVKANGKYAEEVCTDGIVFGSRDSHELHNLAHLKEAHDKVRDRFPNNVYMGELRVWNEDGTIMGRQKGNGIINTKDLDPEIAKRIFFSVWDCVPYEEYLNEKCPIPYDERLEDAKEMVEAIGNPKLFNIIETHIVRNMKEAQELTNKEIANGGEGGVLKKMKAIWKHGTSMEQFKMKRLYEGELRVVGWEYGDKGKKHEHRMGRVILETDDGKVRTACGGGFSDKLRDEDWDNHIGRIAEVEYEEVTLAKGATVYALSGPCAWVDFRDGRDKTDTFKELMYR